MWLFLFGQCFLSSTVLAGQGGMLEVTEVIFEEHEPGAGSYITRMLLTGKMLRMDEGEDDGDFLLFNIEHLTIDSFNHDARSHLSVDPAQVAKIEFDLDFRIEKRVLNDAPEVIGVHPVEHQFLVDNELCKMSINVGGLLPDLRDALLAYERTLALQSLDSVSQLPSEMKTGCYMANNYLHTSAYLEPGFPLLVKDNLGRSKRLVSYRTRRVSKTLFLPVEGYRRYSPLNISSTPD